MTECQDVPAYADKLENELAALKARLPALAEACVVAGHSDTDRDGDLADRILAEWEQGR